MRRSIEEVKIELQKRSAEFEKRRKARLKSLAIGAGAALVLMLAAVPVINGALSAKNGSPMPMTAAYSGGNNSAAQPTDDGNNNAEQPTSGAAQLTNGTDNFKPPWYEEGATADGATTDGMPANSEPTAVPGAPSNSGSNYGGTNSAPSHEPSYDPQGSIEWYDYKAEAYFTVKRGEIIPEKASLIVAGDGRLYSCRIEDAEDVALLTAALYELLDDSGTRETEVPIAKAEYDLELKNAGRSIRVSYGGSIFIGSTLYTADETSLERFNSIVYALFEKHTPPCR